MKRKHIAALAALIIIGALCWTAVALSHKPTPAYQPPPATKSEQHKSAPLTGVLGLINLTRLDENLPVLVEAAELNATAQGKCQHMVENNYWAHETATRDLWSFFEGSGYYEVGEILARGFGGDIVEQHEAWLDSYTHHEQISRDYTDFGMATCKYNNGDDLTVVHFGSHADVP